MTTATLEKFEVTSDRLHELFEYRPSTGGFHYLTRAARRVRIGDEAGSVNTEGYRHIRVGGVAYKAHRLAFFYMTGEWPTEMVDHINGDRADNRWANLRPATRSQNLANSRSFRRGKDAAKGVRKCLNGRWSARIQRDNFTHFLGYFPTEHDAAAAYNVAARDLFGAFAKGASL